MARVLIVGGGRRGQSLARELIARGHVVSETAPDVPATVAALDGVTIACLLDSEHLETLLSKMIDTTVRGVLYEGTEASTVRAACTRSHIPHLILEVAPDDPARWVASASAGVENLLR